MSKPADIPQDVWNAAETAFDLMLCNCIEASGTSKQFRIDSIEPHARAILAERERCAKVCEAAAKQFLSPEYATGQPLSSFSERFACDTCAEGIRSGI